MATSTAVIRGLQCFGGSWRMLMVCVDAASAQNAAAFRDATLSLQLCCRRFSEFGSLPRHGILPTDLDPFTALTSIL
ncbi:hypothetical protein V5799_025261, partial [Amblyomma americanum]